MADDIDRANEAYEKFQRQVSDTLDRMRQSSQSKGAKHCVQCGDDMPELRQNMGFKLCVPCAEENERRKSQFAD